MTKYLVIPRIEVSGANAQPAWWLVTGPSPLAWLGFARKLAIDLNRGSLNESHRVNVAVLHHDLEMRGERFFGNHFPSQLRGGAFTHVKKSSDYVRGSLSMSLQPVALCNLTATLIIEGIGHYSEAMIAKIVEALRFAGGRTDGHGKIFYCEYDEINKRTCNGFFLRERRDLLADRKPEELIPTLIEHLSRRGERAESWLLPTNLGYLPIGIPKKRMSARGSYPHAYAEPLVGLVQYVSKRRLVEEGGNIPFWGYAVEQGAYLARQINNS